MAEQLKQLAKFSEDALNVAFQEMSQETKENFEKGLTFIHSKLGTKERKTTEKTTEKLSDEDIFTKNILPQIERKIKELEDAELQEEGVQVQMDFSNIRTDFDEIKTEQLKNEHDKIVRLENELKFGTLVIQFIRGKLYLFAKESLKTVDANLKVAVEKVFGVPYRTYLRYATLANMFFYFPRLIMCDLTFTQILLHQKRLLKYFKSDAGRALRDNISLPVSLKAMGKTLTIERCDIDVMTVKVSTGPDWAIRDKYDQSRVPSDAEVQKTFDCAVGAYREANEETDLLENL